MKYDFLDLGIYEPMKKPKEYNFGEVALTIFLTLLIVASLIDIFI
jgi:hypothetical protein